MATRRRASGERALPWNSTARAGTCWSQSRPMRKGNSRRVVLTRRSAVGPSAGTTRPRTSLPLTRAALTATPCGWKSCLPKKTRRRNPSPSHAVKSGASSSAASQSVQSAGRKAKPTAAAQSAHNELADRRNHTVLDGLHKLIGVFARCLGYADLPFEVVHHAFMQTNFSRLLRDRHFVDLVLQAQQAVEEIFRPRRTAHDVNIHRHDAVYSLQHGVGIERAANRRASAHRDAPLGIGHLVINALYHRSHLQRNCSGHNHQVALARAGAKYLRPEARDVETRSRSRDHLDRAAGQAERHGPNR